MAGSLAQPPAATRRTDRVPACPYSWNCLNRVFGTGQSSDLTCHSCHHPCDIGDSEDALSRCH